MTGRLLATLLLGLGLIAPPPLTAAELETEIADPPPDFDAPRRILLQISTDDTRKINDTLYNAINMQKFYGMDNVEVAIVVFGPGMTALYKETSPVRERVESLIKYNVQFIGCGNTLEATKRSPEELIDGVDYVQAGVAEIVERQLSGWTYVHP